MAEKNHKHYTLMQALAFTSQVKERLAPFIEQISKGNTQSIFLLFSQIHQYLSASQTELNLKFNSLVAIKILMDTCQYQVILIVQVYFLPIIKKIASYQINLSEKTRGIDYFCSNGYEKTPQNKKQGYNFVRLASQIICIYAIIKPNRLFFNEQIAEPSQFYMTRCSMQSLGWTEYNQLAFFHQNPLRMRDLYLQKLQNLNERIQQYQQFIVTSLQNIIKKDLLPIGLDPRKILEFHQTYTCKFTIELIKQSVLSNEAIVLTNTFRLVTDMVRWGNFGAIHLIEGCKIFDFLIEMLEKSQVEFQKEDNQLKIFQDIMGTQQQKIGLYIQILKSLLIWTVCLPKNLEDHLRDSKSTIFYKKLASDLKIRFPPVSNIKKIRNEFTQNMEKYKVLNERWSRTIKNNKLKISKNRRSSQELQHFFKIKIKRKTNNFIQSQPTIFRQKTKDNLFCYNNDDQSKNHMSSGQSSLNIKQKSPFTQKFYRQKRRKAQFTSIYLTLPKNIAQRRQFKQQTVSVDDDIKSSLQMEVTISDDEEDQSDSEEIEQGYKTFIIKSIESKLKLKIQENHNILGTSSSWKQSSVNDMDECQIKEESESIKARQSIFQNVQFFESMSWQSSQISTIQHNQNQEESIWPHQFQCLKEQTLIIKKKESITNQHSFYHPNFVQKSKQSNKQNKDEMISLSKFQRQKKQLYSLGGKKLLKHKDLLISTDILEVGFISQLNSDIASFSIYITPHHDMNQINYSLNMKDNIKCNENSDSITSIQKCKQKKINFSFRVTPPYLLPIFTLSYQMLGIKHRNSMLLPISYNKFFKFNPIPSLSTNLLRRRQTELYMINKKLFKNKENIYQYFKSFKYVQVSNQNFRLQATTLLRNKEIKIIINFLKDLQVQIQYFTNQKDPESTDQHNFLAMTLLALISS